MNCDKPAVALLTFAPQDAKAWLYDLDQPDPTGGIMLCRKHANATVVPMSWQLVDARDPAWPGPEQQLSNDELLPLEAAVGHPMTAPLVDPSPVLPSDTAAIEQEFAALQADLPVTPQRYAEPSVATARAAGMPPSSELVNVGASTTQPDLSLFELPVGDIPAVTPHPGYR